MTIIIKHMCDYCKKTYPHEQGMHHNRKWCSNSCRQQAYKERKETQGIECSWCGELVAYGNTKFCDRDCQGQWQQEFYAPWSDLFSRLANARQEGRIELVSEFEEAFDKILNDDVSQFSFPH